jgi:hypothetical protein
LIQQTAAERETAVYLLCEISSAKYVCFKAAFFISTISLAVNKTNTNCYIICPYLKVI